MSPTDASTLPVGPRLVAAHWDSLFIQGDPTVLEPPLVAIIGTREADVHGVRLAHDFASALARAGRAVLSGGALGIDAAAHAGALDGGGRTAVVLPSGFEHLYPVRHAPLYREVVSSGGALVSPFPPNTPPSRWTFPRRNELLAALCDLLVVVQAPLASGSLLTAEAARALGRRILVVPASPGDPRGGGCLKLLRMGAEMCATPGDLLAALDHPDGPLLARAGARERVREVPVRVRTREGAHVRGTKSQPVCAAPSAPPSAESWNLDDDGRAVFDALAESSRHVDEITAALARPAARVRATLTTLVLLGAVVDRGGGTFARGG